MLHLSIAAAPRAREHAGARHSKAPPIAAYRGPELPRAVEVGVVDDAEGLTGSGEHLQ